MACDALPCADADTLCAPALWDRGLRGAAAGSACDGGALRRPRRAAPGGWHGAQVVALPIDAPLMLRFGVYWASSPVPWQDNQLSMSQQATMHAALRSSTAESAYFLNKSNSILIAQRGLRAVGAACQSSTACWALRRAPCLLRWTTARTTSLLATLNTTWAALLPWNILRCAMGLLDTALKSILLAQGVADRVS